MYTTMNEITFSSNSFTWQKKRGIASVTDLFQEWHTPPKSFSIKSEKTGDVKHFEIDTQSPGYEDGWDGEYWCYTTDDWFEPVKVIVINN